MSGRQRNFMVILLHIQHFNLVKLHLQLFSSTLFSPCLSLGMQHLIALKRNWYSWKLTCCKWNLWICLLAIYLVWMTLSELFSQSRNPLLILKVPSLVQSDAKYLDRHLLLGSKRQFKDFAFWKTFLWENFLPDVNVGGPVVYIYHLILAALVL